jgi:Fe-S-cluster-containing dehydrogenase component
MAAADGPMWAKVLDQSRCIGCHACTTVCKSENLVPLGVTRTYVKAVESGRFPAVRRSFQVTRCNQCADAPCTKACPTSAMYRRPDGIVDFDKEVCIGCKACIAACPYDAIFINPDDHSAEKCNFCSHRIDAGLEPACAVVCPVGAIVVGDLRDPDSAVARLADAGELAVRRPEAQTLPTVFYLGADRATLDPLAAATPDGGLFVWSEQATGGGRVVAGATADVADDDTLLAYDVPHRRPWDWRVGLYTWTKGLAAGVYLVAAALAIAGALPWTGWLWRWLTPLAALAMLAATGAVLIADLEHPARFHLIFTRPQWRSWLVRGAFVIAAYGATLALDLGASIGGLSGPQRWLTIAGIPLALAAAGYTAYLFAQARARELWHGGLLPAHMLIQAGLLGAALLLAFGPATGTLELVVAGTAVAHVALALAETGRRNHSAHVRLAVRALTRGEHARAFWAGIALATVAAAAPWIGAGAVAPALVGVLLYEHAFVQAGQAVALS